MDLRANTAVDVLIGPFVDSTDGNTTEDSLTISQADVKLSKNGGSLTQKNDADPATIDDDGYYQCDLNTTDTNTEGQLVLIVHESGALPVRHEYNVLSEAAWDSLYAAKDDGFMDVNIKTVGRSDTQETEANNLESACSNYSATRGLTGTAVPAVAAGSAGGIPTDTDSNGAVRIVDGTGARELNTSSGVVFADIVMVSANATAANNLQAQYDGTGLTGDTFPATQAQIGTAGASLTDLGGMSTGMKTEVKSEANDALVDLNLDHLMKTAVGNNADMTTEVADGTVLSNIMSSSSDTSTYTVADDSLQGISEGASGGGATAQQVWEYGTRVLTANTNLNDLDAAGIRTAVGLASANLDTQLADIPTVAEFNARTLVAASYFDPANDTVVTVTTVGTVTNDVTTDAASRTASKADVSGIATSAALATHDGKLDTVDGIVDTILVDTNDLQTNQGNWITATGFAVAGDAMTLTAGERTTLADVILVRAVQNVEDSADRHSLGALIMFVTNWSISGATLTAKKPSDDSAFDTYTLSTTADVDPVTGVA